MFSTACPYDLRSDTEIFGTVTSDSAFIQFITRPMAPARSPSTPITGVEAEVEVVINPPTAIGLVNFYGVYENGVMLVKWTTGWEQNTFGFHIHRSESAVFADAGQITQDLIPGNVTSGGDYVYADVNVAPNVTYWYWLVEVETTGKTNVYGPTRATAATATVPNWSGGVFLPLINR